TFGARNHSAATFHDLPVVAINCRPFGPQVFRICWTLAAYIHLMLAAKKHSGGTSMCKWIWFDRQTETRRLTLTLLCLFSTVTSGCLGGAKPSPDLQRVFAQARNQKGKRPVIFVPGLLGSQLVNERTREVIWPAFFRSSHDELD